MKARLLLAAVAALLVVCVPAVAADRVVERGIVQAVDPASIVLRALDGTDVTVPLGPSTRLRLNGRAVTIAEIRPGLVAEVVTRGTGPALAVRAFGSVERPAVRGVLLRVAPRALLLSRPSGRAVRIALGPATTVWRGGVRVRLRALRPGMRLDVYRGAGGAVRAIVIRSAAS